MERYEFIKEVELTYLHLGHNPNLNALSNDAVMLLAIESVKEEIATIKSMPRLTKPNGIGAFNGIR
ncbi:hypothetical protein KFV08_07835 [Macrococcoides canis]|uniref:hypothetical protein n=1 Tax=Macrococcoides canis TaxID=1855823 RepID=UPI00207D695C|nr:hypothetical protein [Macrococcus canis]MCO4095727.1 hypothetical protein [Macrococcus canis]UTH08436.1 hypothetical protein KFV08_07835 [Macrococcus canis]